MPLLGVVTICRGTLSGVSLPHSLSLSLPSTIHPRRMWLSENAVRGKRQETARILPYAQSCVKCNPNSTLLHSTGQQGVHQRDSTARSRVLCPSAPPSPVMANDTATRASSTGARQSGSEWEGKGLHRDWRNEALMRGQETGEESTMVVLAVL